jgi:hypothetical protein
LYDDRNRFMSPDLGRFLQPDPIGFKGDASNLYRYVGNDWANKTDPTGLGTYPASGEVNVVDQKEMRALQHQIARIKAEIHARSWNPGGGIEQGKLYTQLAHLQQQLGAQPSIAGTNSKLGIPSRTYGTGFSATKTELDRAYDEAKDTKNHEMIIPIGQLDGVDKGGLFAEQAVAGPGVIKTGPRAGDQGSYIDDLPAQLPKGTHLVGYGTVHIHHDPSRLKDIDGPTFERHFGIPARIWMKYPGRGGLAGNWEKPDYFSYPNPW